MVATPALTARHDNTYDTSQVAKWRGNLTTVTRYDAKDEDNVGNRLVTQIGYDTNGSVVFSKDPLNHQTNTSYEDSFSDSVNRNTFAYPTKVTPPTGTAETPAEFESTMKYDYHLGAVTRTQSPKPAGQSQGAIRKIQYDAAGRTSRIDNVNSSDVNNGAYSRWVYDPAGHVSVYGLVQTGGQETVSTTVFDGVGRVRGTSTDNPNSPSGAYRGQLTVYDVMGRASQTSNPSEIDASWAPAGDDSVGWAWTLQSYDWKGRPTTTTKPDGTTKLAEYGGCGCAGGEVVTLRDEVGRKQRMTADIFGRPWKKEVMRWTGTEYVLYSSVTNSYNALDQVTSIVEAGATGPSQTTTLTYDGHGRLKTRQRPSQTAATQFDYHEDDTSKTVTDGRGVVTAFNYNNRHQTTSITYSVPTGATDTPDVAFTYDPAGNRTEMIDGSGSVAYLYDQLSRLTSETRHFTGLSPSYSLSYEYNLANELTKITDPTNASISYAYDKTGRMTDVTGTSFAGVAQYATNVRFRAWGAIKSATYGNSKTLSIGYNNLLQATSYEVPGVLKKSYDYYDDGRLEFTQDQLTTNSKFDRFYTYDYAGRIFTALSGAEARGQGATDDRPYKETLTYDPMNHLTRIEGRNWDAPSGIGPDTYVNNRNSVWTYDADGRMLIGSSGYYNYDAAGRVYSFSDGVDDTTDQQFDGDGRRAKAVHNVFNDETEQWEIESTTYFITSSVLGGQVISELNSQGTKQSTFVYAGGSVLASQTVTGSTESVAWRHVDASRASVRNTDIAGQWIMAAELDAVGANAGLFKPIVWNPPDKEGKLLPYIGFGDINSPGGGCIVDRIEMPCSMATGEATERCPDNHCGGWNWYAKEGRGAFEDFRAFSDGYSGYLPTGAVYRGFGYWESPDGYDNEGEEFEESQDSFLNHPQGSTPCDKILSSVQLPGGEGPGWYRYSPRTGANLAGDPGLMNYAQPNAVNTVMSFATTWNTLHPNHPIGIGEMGAIGGKGDFARHPGSGHAGGNIIDIRPMTIHGTVGRSGAWSPPFRSDAEGIVSYRETSRYSAPLTQDLVNGLWATGEVQSILFNDPQIRNVRPSDKSHDNHLHVVFKSPCR